MRKLERKDQHRLLIMINPEDAADVMLARLNRTRVRSTVDLAIGGGREFPTSESRESTVESLAAQYKLSAAMVSAVLDRYGCKHGVTLVLVGAIF